jgi:hypothetical protein
MAETQGVRLMAISLRISVPRMTVRPLGPVVLFVAERAYAAALRNWGADEADRLALAVAWGRYTVADAHAELATFLAWQAEKAGIKTVSCRKLAAAMLDDALAELDAAHELVCREIVEAVHLSLDTAPDDFEGASSAAIAVARSHQAPPKLIAAGMRIAMRER